MMKLWLILLLTTLIACKHSETKSPAGNCALRSCHAKLEIDAADTLFLHNRVRLTLNYLRSNPEWGWINVDTLRRGRGIMVPLGSGKFDSIVCRRNNNLSCERHMELSKNKYLVSLKTWMGQNSLMVRIADQDINCFSITGNSPRKNNFIIFSNYRLLCDPSNKKIYSLNIQRNERTANNTIYSYNDTSIEKKLNVGFSQSLMADLDTAIACDNPVYNRILAISQSQDSN